MSVSCSHVRVRVFMFACSCSCSLDARVFGILEMQYFCFLSCDQFDLFWFHNPDFFFLAKLTRRLEIKIPRTILIDWNIVIIVRLVNKIRENLKTLKR